MSGARDSLDGTKGHRLSDRTRAEMQAAFALSVVDFVLVTMRDEWPGFAAAIVADGPFLPHEKQSPEVRAMLWQASYTR